MPYASGVGTNFDYLDQSVRRVRISVPGPWNTYLKWSATDRRKDTVMPLTFRNFGFHAFDMKQFDTSGTRLYKNSVKSVDVKKDKSRELHCCSYNTLHFVINVFK